MTACNNTTTMDLFYNAMKNDMWNSWDNVGDYFQYRPWVFSIIGSSLVGLCGIFPLLIIPIDEGVNLKHGAGANTLKMLLSFAVGGLLGDVFLHLLPEAWSNKLLNMGSNGGHSSMNCGLWVLSGFLVFIITEKIFLNNNENDDKNDTDTTVLLRTENHPTKVFNNNNNNNININNHNDKEIIEKSNFLYGKYKKNHDNDNNIKRNGNKLYNGGEMQRVTKSNGSNDYINNDKLYKKKIVTNDSTIASTTASNTNSKHISGYLNLLANCIDNFTHGLAVGGSFLVSFRLGTLTTFAILIHEIPHEVGDFAILLKSGFSKWDAAKAQLITASGGIIGALFAVLFSGSGVESRTSWILPFTAGSFLHIGLVTILPDLLKESNPKESLKQLGALLIGIIIMAGLTMLD